VATLADVYEAYRSDRRFDHLRTEGIVLVPGEGSSRPKVLIVGEAPGATENTQRRPFVGASGRVLRSLIEDSAELESQQYFITNTVKYRPPGNRLPTRDEIEASKPYLRQEWSALGGPSIIVAVGAAALLALKPPQSKINTLSHAGVPVSLTNGAALWPMIHPAYGLRNPNVRPDMEAHWEALGRFVREEAP
jgi:uracil-DNA glycosylase family 4